MATRYDPERTAHKAWLGLLQPVGLVVSPPALIKAQAVIDRNVLAIQQALMAVVRQPSSEPTNGDSLLDDVPGFVREVLVWDEDSLVGAPGGPPVPEHLNVDLRDYNEVPLSARQAFPSSGLLDAAGRASATRCLAGRCEMRPKTGTLMSAPTQSLEMIRVSSHPIRGVSPQALKP